MQLTKLIGQSTTHTSKVGTLVLTLFLSLPVLAGTDRESTPVSAAELSRAVTQNSVKVDEFHFIKEEAQKLGVRAWLFGGTAAGFAHYEMWDLQRQKGDSRFDSTRFDYDFTNIYRSTQDADIVIDGTAEQAQALQEALKTKYPHLQGEKSAWEVRLLSRSFGDKEALLDNPDFLNQNTDSNSTGMIELTDPPNGESSVRDLRDWNNKTDPIFLEDVIHERIHYYQSNLHFATARYRQGKNPPIVSVIRYLTKAFQYDLAISQEDDQAIKEVIDAFDPKGSGLENDYVKNWIEKNGKKLVKNAVDMEYAITTLDRLGLRNKLVRIRDNPGEMESLSWWMSKEPLRSHEVGLGNGKTAKELGIETVAHETKSFSAYESITWAFNGEPNVLISRPGIKGELAVYGPGFYVSIGKRGVRETGMNIRFTLNPDAREGTDFVRADEHIRILNKKALRVIPESLNMDLFSYFKMILSGENIDHSDLGIHQRQSRRIDVKFDSLPPDQWDVLLAEAKRASREKRKCDFPFSVLDVLRRKTYLPKAKEFFNLVFELILVDEPPRVSRLLHYPEWENDLNYIEFICEHSNKFWEMGFVDNPAGNFIAKLLSIPNLKLRQALMNKLVQNGDDTALRELVSKWAPSFYDGPPPTEAQLRSVLSRSNRASRSVGEIVATRPEWKDHSDLMDRAIISGYPWPVSLVKKSQWNRDPKYTALISMVEKKTSNIYEQDALLRKELQKMNNRFYKGVQNCVRALSFK